MKFYQNWTGCMCERGTERGKFFPVEVPGNIQYDYAVANNWGDLMYSDTSRRFRTIEDNYWVYRTELDFTLREGERAVFVAEGIDYIFDIILDGEVLLSYEGMYTRTEVDITDKAKKGSVLEVLIHPHPKKPGSYEIIKEETIRSAASQCCKAPSVYGWDWNPINLISGIWKPAYVETRGVNYIEACEPFYDLSEDRTLAKVRFETKCKGDVTYTVTDMDGKVVYEGTAPEFELKNVELWWCNGQGTPYLYSWTAKSSDDEKSGRIGFRTLRLVRNTGAEEEPYGNPKSRYNAPITVELNGRRIFSKGSNWVNPDRFFGRITKDQYYALLKLAKDANMNLLRLWGGSGLKKAEFYDYCDEMGIMLLQEFMLACNNYEGTPHYLKVLEQEATGVVRELRRHPSIAIWCGGNELFNNWSGMDDQSHATRLLNKICYENDFKRPFIPTSPITGMAHGSYAFEDDGDKQVYEIFQKAHNTAYTEFGVAGCASLENLRKIIPEDELFPIGETKSWIYHHGLQAHGPIRWLSLPIVRKYFGMEQSIEELIERSQWMQCEGYKAIFEEARRQWPYCSMVMNWCYNEPWITAANNSLVSYPADPKPAYYAVKDSLRNTIPSARFAKFNWQNGENFTAQIWYLNDANETVSDTITIVIELDGKEYELLTWNTGDVEARTNKLGPAVNFILPSCENASEMTLRLVSANGNTNSYRLKYDYKGEHKNLRMLNV